MYFARIEPEVVSWRLAIARKILHREAQMITAAHRDRHVALEKRTAHSVRLRANPLDIHFWNEYFAQGAASAPELMATPAAAWRMQARTEIGSTQSAWNHLKEIEQGFFRFVGTRPSVR